MRVDILCSEKRWLVEQLRFFLRKNGVESKFLFLNNAVPDTKVDYVIVRGGPGLKTPESWETLLSAVKSLEKRGIVCVNSSKVIEKGTNKFTTYQLFRKMGIPAPETFLLSDNPIIKKFPVVAKPVMGSEGEGVEKIERKEDINKIDYSPALIQEFLPHGGIDYRAYVVGDRVLGAISRKAKDGWITNLAKGGIPKKYVLSEEEKEIASKSAKAINADIATVDFVVLKKGGKKSIYVLEVNVLPLFSERLLSITGFNFAEEIVKYFLEKYR